MHSASDRTPSTDVVTSLQDFDASLMCYLCAQQVEDDVQQLMTSFLFDQVVHLVQQSFLEVTREFVRNEIVVERYSVFDLRFLLVTRSRLNALGQDVQDNYRTQKKACSHLQQGSTC